jgi:hypothetical protein
MIKIRTIIVLITISALHSISLWGQGASLSENEYEGIKPYSQNPWYWQYRGEPLLLLGGSDEDNPYQWTGKQLTDHLNLLVSVGGNYLRNTMSDRDEANLFAFEMGSDNKYDLTKWNEEYWNRLSFFLDETAKRGIIVQLTLWDQFDIGANRWKLHPWNPDNNVNMDSGTWKDKSDFYSTVERNAQDEIQFQEGYIEKLLSLTLTYDHILYNINNESSKSCIWEIHWAKYIKDVADKSGKKVYVTNMQLSPSDAVRHVMTHKDVFDFVDISQNNQDYMGGRGKAHWDNLMYLREKIASEAPMPMNNVKIYGSLDGVNYTAGSESEAMDRFWRNIFAGCASSRFHRPGMPGAWGSGLNERVQLNLKAMNMLLEELDIMSCTPHNDLLSPRVAVASTMEAYATANIGEQYAIYFPPGRYSINLDPWVFENKLKLRWLDIDNLSWSEPEIVDVNWEGGKHDWGYRGGIKLETSGSRPCVALVEVVGDAILFDSAILPY